MTSHHHHHHHHRRLRLRLSLAAATTVAFLLLASLSSALSFNPTLQSIISKIRVERVVERVPARRRLGGPGSSPPTCRSKCGWCWPCEPVHVAVRPGFSRPLDYYPEAWRCKCGDKLFMP